MRNFIPRPKVEVATHPAVVVIGQLNRATVDALDYARAVADEIVEIHVDVGRIDREQLQQQWQQLESDITLTILDSPYRKLISPISNFISEFEARHQSIFCTVIVIALVPCNWWESLLHNQTAFFLKSTLRDRKSRIVTTVKYHL